MYMLRLISAVLHREPGPAVPEVALDLRPAEVGILLPLVGCLLALSAWPAAISGNALEKASGQPVLAELVSSHSSLSATQKQLAEQARAELQKRVASLDKKPPVGLKTITLTWEINTGPKTPAFAP